ncbi:MAG: GNAT family N-acetyltransferase [Planctomycetaceae bacterium]|nr:GNAT family N-acetyltransferase [Planctomycetaceae bacterium]
MDSDSIRPVAETPVIEYRSFRNEDPPQLVRLWHDCNLGRGAAKGFTPDAFELVNFSQPYFDPHGLILAWDADDLVGMVHAGFGCSEDGSRLAYDAGVIAAVMVRPDRRRQGIGRALVAQAEEYLRRSGSQGLQAGESRGRDPFYFGLYGGARPSGFLLTDSAADPFFKAVDYEPAQRIGVYQRNIQESTDPVHFRLIAIRRTTALSISDQPAEPSWWWYTRLGRVDSIRFQLHPKKGGPPFAAVSVIGLDAYVASWHARCIGIVDVYVREGERGKGYGRTLLVEVARHMRQELISLAEVHSPDANEYAVKAILGAGFERIDTGIVYRKA